MQGRFPSLILHKSYNSRNKDKKRFAGSVPCLLRFYLIFPAPAGTNTSQEKGALLAFARATLGSSMAHPAVFIRDLISVHVGRFVVKSRLGAGGMGEVFLGEDILLKRQVAMK